MTHWHALEDIDAEMISEVLWEFFIEYEEEDHDIPISLGDIGLLPEEAMKDMAKGGEPLIEIKVNQKKLEQLQAKVRAKQQIAETTGEILETYTDKQTGFYEFDVTCQKAMLLLLWNANVSRLEEDLPDIAPSELFNTLTTYQFENNAPLRSMVRCSIDLNTMREAIAFAKKAEIEANKDNPYMNPFARDLLNSNQKGNK